MSGVGGRLLGLTGRLMRFLLRSLIRILMCHAMRATTARIPTMTDTPMVTFVPDGTLLVSRALS